MGAEQSALLVCTQTGKPETPLRLHNAEQFFQNYFDRMAEPRTGPVTEALLHLILNGHQHTLEEREENCWTELSEQDSGYENDELEGQEMEETSDEELQQKIDMTFQKEESVDLFNSDISIESTSNAVNPQIPMELVDTQPIGLDDPKLEFHQELIKRVAGSSDEEDI
ncbi:hypothetical protein ACLKA7_002328 [Drosophila subpalustris]